MNAAPRAVGASTSRPIGAVAGAAPAAAQRDHALQSQALHLLERLRLEITGGRMPVEVTAALAAALRRGLESAAAYDLPASSGTAARRGDLFAAARALSAAERHVLFLIEQGRSAKQIASARNASVNTVRTQIASILRKTGFRSQRELLVQLRFAAAEAQRHLEHRPGYPPQGLDGADDQTSARRVGARIAIEIAGPHLSQSVPLSSGA